MTPALTKRISVLTSHSLIKKESKMNYTPNYRSTKTVSFRERKSMYLSLQVAPQHIWLQIEAT